MPYHLLHVPKFALFAFMLTLSPCLVYGNDQLEVLTENWPPFNYLKDDKVTGFATEIVEATLKNAKIDYVIRLGVWKGVYDKVLAEKNILIYTITRTKQREDLFDWIGPFAQRQQGLYKLKNRQDIKIEHLDDARKYVIGLQDKDAITQDLLQEGFSEKAKNIQLFGKRILSYRSLFAGRVDLVAGMDITIKHQLMLDNLPYNKVEKAYAFDSDEGFYMALKKGSNPSLIMRIKASFENLASSGQLKEIINRYR